MNNNSSNFFGVRHYKVYIIKLRDNIINTFYRSIKRNHDRIIVIFIFLVALFFFGKTFIYKDKLEKYHVDNINEQTFEKLEHTTSYYYSSDTSEVSFSKGTAAASLVQCIKSDMDIKNLNNNITSKISELNTLFNSNNNYFAFLYKDIYTGFTVSYNASAPIFTASTIKAPAMIYLYEMASKNKINLEETLVYDGSFYSSGSGILKNNDLNTSYSVDTLISYAIHESDNIAYAMLMNRYGRSNILEFWKEKGTKNIFTYDTIWGTTSAEDAAIYMQELYDFYMANDEYGNKLFDYFTNAYWKQVSDKDGKYNTANKGGWSDETFHDVAIVSDENPYILIILSTTGYSDYNYLFGTTSKLVGQLHSSYWQYKLEECSKIKQY